VARLGLLVDPGVEIPAEATAVHGVTTEHAREHGTPAAVAVPRIVEALADARAAGHPIVAFNARFDLTILDREARRYGVSPLGDRPAGLRVVDPLVIDKWLHRYRKGSRKLEALCAQHGVTLDGAHEAGSDAIAAARLARVIGKRGQVVARYPEVVQKRAEWKRIRDDLDELHAAQVAMAREQAVSLAAYFARKGEPQHVEPEWPVVPVPAVEAAA
jgi:DNA polymerase III subunit epsilon